MGIPQIYVDRACAIPVVQTVIGVSVIVVHAAYAVYEIARGILMGRWNTPEDDTVEKLRATCSNPRPWNVSEVGSEPRYKLAILKKVMDLPGVAFDRHVAYMKMGFLRAIPIVGTMYTYHRRSYLFNPHPSEFNSEIIDFFKVRYNTEIDALKGLETYRPGCIDHSFSDIICNEWV